MSIQIVADFVEKLKSDPKLHDRLKALPHEDEEAAIRGLVEIARDAGYEFSADEYQAYVRKRVDSGEISEEELDKVAGGTLTVPLSIAFPCF